MIEIFRGDDEALELTILDENGDPVDLTGSTIFFTMKKSLSDNDPNDDDAIIKKDITSHDPPSNESTTISLTDSDTDQELGYYVYDIQWKDTSGNIKTIRPDDGKIKIHNDVTKRTS